jgi:hypothetical protein
VEGLPSLLQRLRDAGLGLDDFLDRAVFVEEEFIDADGAAEALSGLAVARAAEMQRQCFMALVMSGLRIKIMENRNYFR